MNPTINNRNYELQSCGLPRCYQEEPGNVVRMELRPDDVIPVEAGRGVERNELCGIDRFMSHINVEYDLMVEPGGNTAAWLLLNQFHQDIAGSPPFAIELDGVEFRVVLRSPQSTYTRVFADPNFKRGQWYWLKIAIDLVNGALSVKQDNQQIVDYKGPIGFPDPKGGYWKAGIYRAPAPETMIARYRGMVVNGA